MTQPIARQLVTGPICEPVGLDEAKQHLRLPPEPSEEDAVISRILVAARTWVEEQIDVQCITATWRFVWDRWPGIATPWGIWPQRLLIPRPPLQAVLDVRYRDPGGTWLTLDPGGYEVTIPSAGRDGRPQEGMIRPAIGSSWPPTADWPASVEITVRAGWGDTGALVPQPLRQAILILVGELYLSREAASPTDRRPIPMGVEALIGQYGRPYGLVR
jgi:uncharacterized phiE125 gp8 family phage protein